MVPLAMPPAHYGPPSATEAAAAHGFAAVPQQRPVPLDPSRMHSMAPQALANYNAPASPTGTLLYRKKKQTSLCLSAL